MFRSRLWRSLLLLFGMFALLYLTASLFLPSSRWMIVGVNRKSGRVRHVEQTLTFLPPHLFYRLSFEKRDGSAQRDGITRIVSQDGVPVTVNYRLRFAIAGDHLPDVRRLVNDGFTAWMQARVAEAVSAVTTQVPIEDLLSPTSAFNMQRDSLRRTVAAHLAASGLKVTAFEIARLDVDREALLAVKRAQLRRDARSVPARVAVFAIDGADWELLAELKDDGRIPNLKALMAGGTIGSVQTIQPTVAPLVWTTVATGLPPDRHGVIDFIDRSRNSPVDATTRRAPALWDTAEAFGRGAVVVNWWTAWPPTSVAATVFDSPGALLTNAVSPPDMQRVATSYSVPLQTIGYDQVHRFLNITPAEYDAAVSSGNASDPINILRFILAKTWSDHRVAINAFRQKQPLLMMIEYDGTDAVNHLFAPFHPPQRGDIRDGDYRKYWPAVSNYYAEIDRLIGEWMTVLPPDTTVVLMSAYGFRWGRTRPTQMPNGGAALSDHRNPGIFIGYGQHIVHSAVSHSLSVYDITPTVLALLGLPKAVEMPGQIATWALKDVTPIDSVRVVSYAEFVGSRPSGVAARVDLTEFQQRLQAIGHLNDPTRNLTPVLEQDQPAAAQKPLPPEKWGAYAYTNNLGVQLRAHGKLQEAADTLQQAIELNPNRPVPYLNLAMVLFDRAQYADADEAFLQAVSKGLPNAEHYIVDFAALYRARDMSSRAIALLYKGKELFPQSYLIAANLGSSLMQANRYSEGQPELERALGLQPSSTMVLDNLGVFYAKKNDYARALDYWNRSLSIDPRQPQIRAAADAARTRL